MNSKTKGIIKEELGDDALTFKRVIMDFLVPNVRSFQRVLRILEGMHSKGLIYKLLEIYYLRLSSITGLTIPLHVCGTGLTIYHHGSIVVNESTRIGRNCCIMNNVNIGANAGSDKAPQIGNDVYIGPGAVIYGDIFIADGCYIGANAVVNKSVYEPHSVVVGVPAKMIKFDYISWWEKNNLKRNNTNNESFTS